MVDRSVPNSLCMCSRLMFLSLNAQTGLSVSGTDTGSYCHPSHTCGEHEILMSTDPSSNMLKKKESKGETALNINATSI